MATKYNFRLIVPAALFGMVLSVPAFAQEMAPANPNANAAAPASEDMNAPAGQQMRAAGREMKGAGEDTAAAAKDTFHGTERAAVRSVQGIDEIRRPNTRRSLSQVRGSG